MEQKVLELRQSGMGYKKIAKQLGLSNLQVSDILFANGITDHMIMPSQNKIQFIVDQYNAGKGTKWIANEMNISPITVRNVLKVNGITLEKSGYHRNYDQKIDHSYFSVIDTEHKAYWFGFLMADGYNDEKGKDIEVTLKVEDIDHLRLLREDLKAVTCNIKHKTVFLNGSIYEAVRLILYSKQLSNDLKEKGCVQKKSLIAVFPTTDIVPVTLQRHFIRGYYDGNGCFSINTISKSAGLSIDSNETLCYQIANIIANNVSNLTNTFKYYQRSQAGSIRMTGRINALRILDWLYDQNTICLARKFNHFVEIINMPFRDGNTSGEKPCELLETLRRKYQAL